MGSMLCVIADDEQRLALFPAEGADTASLISLLPGELPQDAAERKAAKPDFEILVPLHTNDNCLLAIGSGSTAERMRGALVILPQDEEPAAVQPLDLRPLFDALAPLVPKINLEGAFIAGDRLTLFNRGNMSAPETLIFETALSFVTEGQPAEVKLLKQIALPSIAGVPLTVTDACRLDDGTIILASVAEATGDSYTDGALAGAAIILLDEHFNVTRAEWIDPAVKVEGITARRIAQQFGHGIELLCVTDPDDPDLPSMLYSAILEY